METETTGPARRAAGVRAVLTPALRRLLWILGAAFAVLTANSLYLVAVRVAGAAGAPNAETPFSLGMFLLHVILGLALLLPFLGFLAAHTSRAWSWPNRRAFAIGVALALVSILVAATGILLTRVENLIELRDSETRRVVFWLHVVSPLLAGWLYLLHRRRGKPLQAGQLRRWITVTATAFALAVGGHWLAARRPPTATPEVANANFFPSLARTRTGQHLDAAVFMADSYCQQCHADVHEAWSSSAHRFSSFNNPAYKFSVLETRRVSVARDGDLRASRWCAGCHDPVPFFSGKFDRADFDTDHDPTALAGLTCTACHAIQSIDSVRGNAAFTIDEPEHYPFAFSDSTTMRWLSRQLVRARPELHKETFLKPLHRTTEFCSSCHKVHLPPELNGDRWLRGQNHYDSFRLSGASGHSASSFYYPEKAFDNCASCHMPTVESTDFGARDFAGDGKLAVHDHQFPGANTGLGTLVGWPEASIEKTRALLRRSMRVDLFGLRDGGGLEDPLSAPLRPALPEIRPGKPYLVEAVVRNLFTGHEFTQGTADSNEVWLALDVLRGERKVAASGELRDDSSVDPRSYFLNAWVIDREGRRIDRRNPQDIFTVLYNHQIPPGSATVVPFRFTLPPGGEGPVTLRLRARYRKFDLKYVQMFLGEGRSNDLPIVELASDEVILPVADDRPAQLEGAATAASQIPEWQRWNDYGIGLLRQAGPMARGSKESAIRAFAKVEELGRPDGALNQVRIFLSEGEDPVRARGALERAKRFEPPAPPWLLAWFEAQVARREGKHDQAIAAVEQLIETPWPEARKRGFDFSGDDRVWLLLGQLELERAQERPDGGGEMTPGFERARVAFSTVLERDPENMTAHYSLARIARALGREAEAEAHIQSFERYRADDPDRDRARDLARRADPIADFQAEPLVIYELRPPAEPQKVPEGGKSGASAMASVDPTGTASPAGTSRR